MPSLAVAARRGSAAQVATAIRGAIILAKTSIVPVRRGYWGNKIGSVHTVPAKTTGKCGSVTVRLIPAPRGAGIVAARTPKKVLQMAGIEDCYTASRGSTKTLGNFVKVMAGCPAFCCFASANFLFQRQFSRISSLLEASLESGGSCLEGLHVKVAFATGHWLNELLPRTAACLQRVLVQVVSTTDSSCAATCASNPTACGLRSF
jgi:hypothetical protein